MPGISKVESAIGLLAGNRAGNYQRAARLIAECSALAVAVTEQEIGKIFTVASARALYVAGPYCARRRRCPRSGKGDQPAAGVGLKVVVVTLFELDAPSVSVVPSDHGYLGREVELSVVVGDRALSLAATDQRVVLTETRRQRSALDVGDERVVCARPALLRHVKAAVDGVAEVNKSTEAGVEVEDGSWADGVVIADSHALALGVFGAPVLAESGAERILCQA